MSSPKRSSIERDSRQTRVGLLIRQFRDSHVPRITQEELAERTGFRQSRISKIERGVTKRPSKPDLEVIAAALGVDPDPLLIAADYTPVNLNLSGATRGSLSLSGELAVLSPGDSYREQLATQAIQVLQDEDWKEIEEMLERRRREKQNRES